MFCGMNGNVAIWEAALSRSRDMNLSSVVHMCGKMLYHFGQRTLSTFLYKSIDCHDEAQ